MQTKPSWPRPTTEAVQLQLPLPPRPGIQRIRADVCPRCHGVHLRPEERTECLQANAQREQF